MGFPVTEMPVEESSPPQRLFGDFVQMISLSLVIVIGAPLNLHVFMRLLDQLRKTPEHSVKRSFLLLKMNLNVSDLLIIMVPALGRLLWLATYEWRGGDLLCPVFHYFTMLILYLSSNIIVCIAIDRLRTVLAANRVRQTQTHGITTIRLITFAWIFAAFCSLPQLYVWRTITVVDDWVQCTDIFQIRIARNETVNSLELYTERVHGITHILLVFYIPLLILIACYLIILVKLLQLSIRDPTTSNLNGVSSVFCHSRGATLLAAGEMIRSALQEPISASRSLLEMNNRSETPDYFAPRHSTISALVRQNRRLNDQNSPTEQISLTSRPIRSLRNGHSPSDSRDPSFESQMESIVGPFSRMRRHYRQSSGFPKKRILGFLSPPSSSRLPLWRRQMRSRVFCRTLFIVAVHILFWLPYNIYGLAEYLSPDLFELMNQQANYFKDLQYMIVIINPFLYGFGGD